MALPRTCLAPILGLALLASACAPAPAPDAADGIGDTAPVATEATDTRLEPPMPVEPPIPRDPGIDAAMERCDADAARDVVGEVATAEVVERARKAAGAELVRTLKPGQMVTMEYHFSRLNIDVDEDNVITGVRCG